MRGDGILAPDMHTSLGALLALVAAAAAFAPSRRAAAPRRRRATALRVAPSDARIYGGLAGLGLIVLNRIFVAGELAYGDQSQADLLAVAATVGLVLDGLSMADIEAREAEVVELKGVKGRGVSKELAGDALAGATWASETILESCAPVKAVFLWHEGSTILRLGVLGKANAVDADAVTFREALAKAGGAATYVPDLQAVPARVDFSYLPRNTQSALIQPFADGAGAVVVGCDRKRALVPRDVAWIKGAAARLGDRLNGA